MIKKPTRIAIALVLALGLILSSANVALAKPQPVAEIINLHLDGTSLHFQLHLVNLHQAFYYKVSIKHNDGSNVTDTAFSPIGKLSREGNSAEISRGIVDFGDVSGHYDVQVELFNRKQVSLGSTPTATYTCYFTVTFYETNGLSDVTIQVFRDSELENPVGDPLTTDAAGNAAIELPDGVTYYYGAAKIDYYELSDNFTLAGANLTENFTMQPFNTVTFAEANELSDVSIQIYSDSALQDPIGDPLTTNSSGEATIKLPNGIFYWAAAKANFFATGGNFTLFDAPYEVDFEMLPGLYTVTFNETNGLSGVDIDIYDYYSEEWVGAVTTNATGQATTDLPDDTYYYYATKSGYVSIEDIFTVSGAPLTESFTMIAVYTVTFNETNSLPGVYIEIYNDDYYYITDVTTNATGQATIDLAIDSYYYYATKSGYYEYDGDFTVSDSDVTESFAMSLAPGYYGVTFNNTNGLSGVLITIWDDWWDQIDVTYTDMSGQATSYLQNGDYIYEATKSGYASAYGEFIVDGSAQTIDFTMNVAYTVTFDETNGLSDVYIEVWDDIAEEWVGEVTTNETGQAIIDLPDSSYYFYPYMDEYMSFEGNFTVSGESLTVPFEMIPCPFVTFNETNGLPDVYIDVYADSALTDYINGFWTDASGQATMVIYEAGTYYYEAMMTGYGDLVGDFTVSVSNITESFTMENGYYVLFIEDNSEMAILQLFSDSGLTIAASSPFATNEYGNATRELANGTYYYKATRFGFNDCTGNFTVSGEVAYEHFEMIPMAGVIFIEDFLGVASGVGSLPVGWTTNASSLCYVRGSTYAGGYVPELALEWTGGQETYSDYYVSTPSIDATGISGTLNLSFKSYFDLYGDYVGHPYTYAVQTSDDGGASWTTVLEESPTFDTYPDGYFQRTEDIDISACAGKTFRICWRLYGYTYWMDWWYIDDVLVTGETGEPLTGIGPITGTPEVGQTLTAGALSPAGATAAYQWKNCATADGSYADISGATNSTYILVGDDLGMYIKVQATGTGSYTGTVTSAATAPVTAPLTGIGSITGTPVVGQTLTAGTLSPAGATATYQWRNCDTVDGSYADISGATNSTYMVVGDDLGMYIKVQATGTGSYTGTVTSAATAHVTTPLTGIGSITGTPVVGQTLTAGALSPAGATATYQWRNCDTVDGSYADISGATNSTYMLVGDDLGLYIKVQATGTGSYTGTVTSAATALVTTPLTGIGAITGTAVVGQTLTAGALTPVGATATYQWWSAPTVGGPYTDSGATSNTYNLVAGDLGKFFKVVATGTGSYTGTVTSAATAPVTTPLTGIGAISGTAVVGQTLTAGALSPAGATATYQWQRCPTEGGSYMSIEGANSDTYLLPETDFGYYIKVQATGTGSYTGTVISAATNPVELTATPITAIGAMAGSPIVGNALTAGELSPAGANATYQWQICDTVDGSYADISTATSNTYVTVAGDVGKYVKVVATGSGAYTGSVLSEPRKIWAGGPLFVEDFYGVPVGGLPVAWTLMGTTSQLAFVDADSFAGGESPQLELDYDWGPGEDYDVYSDYRISTLAINATGATSALNLSFKSYFDIWDFRDDYPFTFAVEVSTDGGATWNATSYSITINASSESTYPSYEIGPETVNIDLGAYKGQTIKISWRMYQYTYQANMWNIDDVVVTGS